MGLSAGGAGLVAAVAAVSLLGHLVRGHGRLIEPPSRASAWRYGFSTPADYNDHESYCGGFTRQWQRNGGKCGVCGDPWDSPTPRKHELGGAYGQGVIVRRYNSGGIANIRVELTANHNGFFEFRLCDSARDETQQCLDRHVLRLAKPQDGAAGDVAAATRYYPRDGNKIYEIKYRLPDVSCAHCILQWRYVAGNNWGTCPDGSGAVGCGPQEEFRACADVAVTGAVPTTAPTSTPETPAATDRPDSQGTSRRPLLSLLVAGVTLLLVVALLAVLYTHYYEVGGRVKLWIKGRKSSEPPVPPPRTRRRPNEPDELA